MKRGLYLCLLMVVICLCSIKGQVSDPIIMNVAGKDVPRSEFEYSFNKNSQVNGLAEKSSVESYIDMFINYKLKVQAALDAHFDTLSSFINEFRTYRDMQLKPYLRDTLYEDSLAYEVYKNVQKSVGDSDIILVAHILLQLPQKAGEEMKEKKKALIDSIYTALQGGADFATLAKKYSEDFGTSQNGGVLPWIGPNSTIPEFEKVAYSLRPGLMSKPFLSSAGYHIILMKERKKLEPYVEKKAEIMEVLKSRGVEDMSAENKIKKMVGSSNGSLTREDIMQTTAKEAEMKDPNLKYLIKEYHDGLLLYEVSNRLVWQKAAVDESGLAKYFKQNKSKYTWDGPRFKGYVIHAKREALLAQIKKELKKAKGESGIKMLNKSFNSDTLKQTRIKYGVFKAGDDNYVDFYSFGKEAPKANKLYPYYGCVGKTIKAPEEYEDVKAQVVSDYQDMKEKEWVESLRKHYSFKVNNDVVQTVNKH